jgi:hypothetical protein
MFSIYKARKSVRLTKRERRIKRNNLIRVFVSKGVDVNY